MQASQRPTQADVDAALPAAAGSADPGFCSTVADEAPAVIWAADTDGRLAYANRRFEAVCGRPAATLLGDGWQPILRPGSLRRLHAAFRVARRRRAAFQVEVKLHIAAQVRWYRCEAVPRFAADGALSGFLGCSIDVTDAKAAEAALRELNRTLECRVAERTAQLAAEAAARSAAQDRLRHTQKLEALGQLSGGVAHDFNNASAAVLAGIALLEKRHGATLAEAGPGALRLLSGLREAAERGAAISRRMLAFARREELRAIELDPAELLRNLRAVLGSALAPTVRVAVDVPLGLPPLRADRAQLETTLINLAVNARDAMPDGGTVTLGASAETVTDAPSGPPHYAAGLPPGDYIRLWVADTGTGMDAETLARAAEPFFTTKSRDKGTGLGLSMADGFAAQSGGMLAIDSAPGRGTTISLWLPCAVVARNPAVGSAERRGFALVVDDQPMMRRFLAECLAYEGWAVHEAENGGQALVHLDAGHPCDLLISDLAMPGMDGTALIQAARMKRPELSALLLTGTGHMAELAPLATRGRFALLRKPVSPAELAECVASLAVARSARQAAE